MRIFSRVAVQMYGWRLFTCDMSCHQSVTVNNTKHIRGRRPAGLHSAKHVKHPAESKRLLVLPINASTSQITTPGVWECSGQHTGTRCPPESSLTTLNTTTCLSSVSSISHSLPSPPYALQPKLDLYITFHLLRGNGHSSHQLAGPELNPGTQMCRLIDLWDNEALSTWSIWPETL